MDHLLRAKYAYKNVNFRYVVAPTTSLEGGFFPFKYDAKQIESNINHGIKDAQQVIALGPGKSFERLTTFGDLKTRGQMHVDYGTFLQSAN